MTTRTKSHTKDCNNKSYHNKSFVETTTGLQTVVPELHAKQNPHNIHTEERRELSLFTEDIPTSSSPLIVSSNNYNNTPYNSISPTSSYLSPPQQPCLISEASDSSASSTLNSSQHSNLVVEYRNENEDKEGNSNENSQKRSSRVFQYLKHFDILPQVYSLKSYLHSYNNSTDQDEHEKLFDSTYNDLSFYKIQLTNVSASTIASLETSRETNHQLSTSEHIRLGMERKTTTEPLKKNKQSTNSTLSQSLSFESQSSTSKSYSSNRSSNNSPNRYNSSISVMVSSNAASSPASTSPSNQFSLSSLFAFHSLADKLHKYPNLIVSHGRATAIGLILSYLFFLALWFPVWLLSFIVTELGVYCGITIIGFKIGRAILRLIAFPGASQRVSSEIGSEFAKYVIRTLESALDACVETANLILSSKKTNVTRSNNSGSDLDDMNDQNGIGTVTISHEFPSSWAHVCSYRNRIFGMLSDVLFTLLCEDGAGINIASSSNGESSVFTSNPDNLTSYGNNKLFGDIGDLSGLSEKARTDGVALSKLLVRILNDLKLVDEFCCNIGSSGSGPVIVNEDIVFAARQMLMTANEFRDFLSVLKRNQNSSSSEKDDETNQTNNADSNKSSMQMIKATVTSIIPMLDPPPYPSIFCLDVSRGCLLSRYRGAKQMWIQRPRASGMIDAIYIPCTSETSSKKKAVLYCNPNAGFYEVAAGVNFFGGTIQNEKDIDPQGSSSSVEDESCWTDFYLQNGYDVMLFNYTGYGRSYGLGLFGGRKSPPSNKNSCFSRLTRIMRSFFFEFKPSPSSLKEDALTIARHLTGQLNVENLIIHGESIGGMAAASAARRLSQEHERKLKRNGGEFNLVANTPCEVSALICDRTFSNLIAVAQHLVGEWSGTAIRILAPFWQTDVTYDFLTANCPKIVCNDAADAIIADASSLKSGVSQAKELRKGNTKGVGMIKNAPLEYRMADFEGLGVLESTNLRLNAPVWPVDKHITEQEAFHFAACVTRIGKLATAEKKRDQKYDLSDMNNENMRDENEGVEMTVSSLSRKTIGKYLDDSSDDSDNEDNTSPLFKSPQKNIQNSLIDVWNLLACCYGLCGAHLGEAVKGGPNCILAWLCSAITYGSQHVAGTAERRLGEQAPKNEFGSASLSIKPTDFDYILDDLYVDEDNEIQIKPISLPTVVEELKKKCTEDDGKIDGILDKIGDELRFCIDILEYIIARTSSTFHVSSAVDNMHFRNTNDNVSVGSFLKLHCGHNNMFAKNERDKLRSILREIIGEDV